MIRITCASCRKVLTIDDAFAGGVCRCQHCGTIQTVPAHLKGTGGAPPPPNAPVSKTLFENKIRTASVRSAAEAEQNAVAPAPAGGPPASLISPPNRLLFFTIAGAVFLLLLFVALLLARR